MNMLESISSYNFVVIDKYAYFSNMFYNAFFKVELKTGKTFFLGSFENEKLAELNIHYEIMLENDRIYFFPRRGCHIHIYNLSKETMQAVEIRDASEEFYVIDKIILKDNFIYFLPKQKNNPIKRLERDTYKVTKVNDRLRIQGEYLSECRKIIPTVIREKCRIKHEPPSSCELLPDGKWYCFMPFERQMLRFTEGTYNLETVPLIVMNETEFQKHLGKVKQELFKARTFFYEFENFKISNYLEEIILYAIPRRNYCKEESRYSIGETIWKVLKE